MTSVAPINIAAAALWTQALLAIIIVIGAALWRPFLYSEERGRLIWPILISLVGLVPVIFSGEYSSAWQPMVGTSAFPLVRLSIGILLMFILDIVCAALLVGWTGGSRNSPFAAIYFVLPSLAIFLRQPFWAVTLYTSLVIGLFSLQLLPLQWGKSKWGLKSSENGTTWAFGTVSALCVLLTTIIGWVTRPQ